MVIKGIAKMRRWNHGNRAIDLQIACINNRHLMMRASRNISHRSTNQARTCLTSLSRREAVLSCWYGRSHHNGSLTYSQNLFLFWHIFCCCSSFGLPYCTSNSNRRPCLLIVHTLLFWMANDNLRSNNEYIIQGARSNRHKTMMWMLSCKRLDSEALQNTFQGKI